MAVTDSRIKLGTLTVGTAPDELEISCQATAVSLEPSTESTGEAVEVLCGDQLPESSQTTWKLKFTGIQDWSDPEGFIMWALEHDQQTHPVTWAPSGATGPTFATTCTVQALKIGGDVAKRNTSDAEWPCTVPVPTFPPP